MNTEQFLLVLVVLLVITCIIFFIKWRQEKSNNEHLTDLVNRQNKMYTRLKNKSIVI